MPHIHLETQIDAPIERVFDLARSIDAHTESAAGTHERAVGGRTSGLIEAGETVTWEARHFGVKQRLSVRITRMERPAVFEDEMIAGAFQSMRHRHQFVSEGQATRMVDDFHFRAPLGILGRVAERVFLHRYMRCFLEERNRVVKDLAESEAWQRFVPPAS